VRGTTTPDGIEITEGHPMEGGMGYSKKHMRPDLSNTSFMLYAMEESGVPHDDPAIQRAMAFVSRCQNNPETNPLGWAKEGPGDGGMVYAPAKNPKLHGSMVPESKADPDTGLRSYGSMTYSGFKSLLYATGMNRNDDRVLAAFDWIRSNWTLETNPNMPGKRSQQGLYYYYHAFAKALRAWGEDRIKTMDGKVHNWREELIDTLDKNIRDDGSWVNEASRWMEADPRLVTCYSVLALQESLHK
jgi:squalene-hopene/tetraprenyl-beta-curcumene cyclase